MGRAILVAPTVDLDFQAVQRLVDFSSTTSCPIFSARPEGKFFSFEYYLLTGSLRLSRDYYSGNYVLGGPLCGLLIAFEGDKITNLGKLGPPLE